LKKNADKIRNNKGNYEKNIKNAKEKIQSNKKSPNKKSINKPSQVRNSGNFLSKFPALSNIWTSVKNIFDKIGSAAADTKKFII
jgi:hypothetical protein